jgi:potassium/hydrogen antiporter
MQFSIELILVFASLLLILSVVASKISDRLGIPALLFFLIIGMLAGSDGPGGIYFDSPALAQYIGIIALAVILFSGGLETNWRSVSPTFRDGLALSTVGVMITASVVAFFTNRFLGFGWIESFLLGAIVSSTDAAAVFSILRSRGVALRSRVRSLLELESGSNDPMAVFLTVACVRVITGAVEEPSSLLLFFISQALLGLAFGYAIGVTSLFLVNRLRLGYEGLYPVLIFAIIMFAYGITTFVGGSGFLAVYVAGIVMGRADFLHKGSLIRFYDGLAWMMQILMFLALGLLVFPTELLPVAQPALLIALALIFVARPLSVFISLLFSPYKINEKLFLSWVGLRGAVPIVLATYPLLAGIELADLFFNVVFFVVLLSILLQGTSVTQMARWLKVIETEQPVRRQYPIEYTPTDGFKGILKELQIPASSPAVGMAVFELHLPPEFLVILIVRGDGYLIPSGGTVLEKEDILLALSNEEDYDQVYRQVAGTAAERLDRIG